MNVTLGARVRQCRLALNWSQAELARRLNVKQQSIDQLESGKVTSPRYVIELAEALSVPLEWLRHGKGKMRFAQSVPGSAPTESTWTFEPAEDAATGHPKLAMRGVLLDLNDQTFCLVPQYDARATANPGSLTAAKPEPLGHAIFAREWLKRLTASPPQELALVRVSGDAMSDTLNDGDQVLVDRTANRYVRDGLYVLRYAAAGELMVKRLTRHPATGLLALASDNTRYGPPVTLPDADIVVEGRVVWLGKTIG